MMNDKPIIIIDIGCEVSQITPEMLEKLYEIGTGNHLYEIEASPFEKALSIYTKSEIYDPNALTEQEKFFKMKEQKQFRKMCKRGIQ